MFSCHITRHGCIAITIYGRARRKEGVFGYNSLLKVSYHKCVSWFVVDQRYPSAALLGSDLAVVLDIDVVVG
jgi:hypothetical protein